MTASARLASVDDRRKLLQLQHYASRGWRIFPCYEPEADGRCSCGKDDCKNQGKHPRVSSGLNSATSNDKRIRDWHRKWPDANWAVACGASDLAVVDIDPRNGGDDTLAELEAAHGRLPDTVRCNTGGGGQHYFFAGAVATGKLGMGVDLKSIGGYVVITPSVHVSGTRYEWDVGSPAAFAPTPQWVKAAARVQKHQHLSVGAVTDGWLGAAFDAAGWLGRGLPGNKATCRCPWEHEHTSGGRHDTSTVVFAPYPDSRFGAFFCAHSHCSHRKLHDVVPMLPASARDEATRATGVDPLKDRKQKPKVMTLEEAIPGDVTWRDSLRMHADGVRITRDVGNLALILANMPEWAGTLAYDEFSQRTQWERPVPEIAGMDGSAPKPGDELADVHLTYIRHWLATRWSVVVGKDAVADAVDAAARSNAIHPLRDYLESLEWDRTRRVPTWIRDYLSGPDVAYSHAVGRWWMISAVARAFRPGCQVDHMLVLEGLRQGEGKSSALSCLGGEWFLGALPDLKDKDAKDALRGRWIVEVGEMDAFRKQESSRVKDFVSQRTDRFRPAYGKYQITAPRTCVFAGTTNEDTYLTDPTGARRFWPVRVSQCDLAALRRDRDQLWAEAVHLYRCGEQWWPSDVDIEELTEAQAERYNEDVWTERVVQWINAAGLTEVSLGTLLERALGIEPGRWTKADQTRLGSIMRRIGWSKERVSIGGRKCAVYRAGGINR